MKKSLAVLLLAVLLPSLGLGWLALRNAEEQQIILERRTAELFQNETEAVAATARALVNERQRAFVEAVRRLLAAQRDPQRLAAGFTTALAKQWEQKAIGFAIGRDGRLLCPTAADAEARVECRQFLWDNGAFLGNKIAATVYPVQMDELARPDVALKNRAASYEKQQQQAPPVSKAVARAAKALVEKSGTPSGAIVMQEAPAKEAYSQRNVAPQQGADVANAAPPASELAWATSGFRELVAEGDEGVINRFVQDRLNMIFWVRPAQAREFLFGCLIDVDDLRGIWKDAFPGATGTRDAQQPQVILALLDDRARAVATQPASATVRGVKQPFVASEIGEALPHWEAALYLRDPAQLRESARKLRRTLSLLIAAALGAIACGGWAVLADTRRQLALAQKKTDFVSNVSHELKTPLTSIRMFAELMHDGRADPAKSAQYLRIIMVEAERLTRLINNVLDFAGLERRQKRLDKRSIDLHGVIARVWEGHELHLRDGGFATHWEAAPPPYPVLADADALAQVLVNLLSNAEKYSGERKEIAMHTDIEGGTVCVSVLDRGSGVPPGEETKIFQAFYRAHDSLASGIQGSGLGLTLAQRLVQEHGGDITFQPREGGGSCFTIRLPRAANEPNQNDHG